MGIIPDEIFSYYNSIVDELYENKFISKEATIVYRQKINCPNCIPGYPNKYNGSGPTPFSFGPCPYCNGQNYIEEGIEDKIRLRAYFNRKDFAKIANTTVNDAEVMILFKKEMLNKIIKAEYISLFSDIESIDLKFVLIGEPTPFGFGSTQFSAYLRRR